MNNQKRILLASENIALLNELNTGLRDNQITIAISGLKGAQLIEKLRIEPPDLTILDLPDISVAEIKQLIAIRQVLDIPVMLLDSQNIGQNCIEMVRFNDTATYKQISPLKDLIDDIRKLLNR